MRKKVEILTMATLVAKKCKRSYSGACCRVWWSRRLARVWNQAIGCVLIRLAEIWLQ